jgi:hypothetical protein
MEQSETLLMVARAAHERGEIAEAKQLHLEILSLYPRTAEAEAAVHYLTGGYLMPAEPAGEQPDWAALAVVETEST